MADTDEMDTLATISVLDHLINGSPFARVANRHGMTPGAVQVIGESAGWPDRSAMRSAKASLSAEMKATKTQTDVIPAPRIPEPDEHPALAVIERLSAAARDRDQRTMGALISGFDLAGRDVLIRTMAALIPPGGDLGAALEWIDLPPDQWSPSVLWFEVARYKHGARDKTCRMAAEEVDRRAAGIQETATDGEPALPVAAPARGEGDE